MHKSCFSLLLAFVVVTQGCGSDFKPVPLVAVSGKLSSAKPFDSKGLGVMFVDAKGSASGSAKLEADGTFKGEAPVGEIVAYLYGAAQEGAAPGAGHADSSTSKTKKEFWNAETSPWKVTIPAEGKTDIDLSLDANVAIGASGGHGAM